MSDKDNFLRSLISWWMMPGTTFWLIHSIPLVTSLYFFTFLCHCVWVTADHLIFNCYWWHQLSTLNCITPCLWTFFSQKITGCVYVMMPCSPQTTAFPKTIQIVWHVPYLRNGCVQARYFEVGVRGRRSVTLHGNQPGWRHSLCILSRTEDPHLHRVPIHRKATSTKHPTTTTTNQQKHWYHVNGWH